MKRAWWERCTFTGCLWCLRSNVTLARIGHSCDCRSWWLKRIASLASSEVDREQDSSVSGAGQ